MEENAEWCRGKNEKLINGEQAALRGVWRRATVVVH